MVKNPPTNKGDIEMCVHSLGQEDPLEEGLATHSSILAWRISWTEEPDGLQSIASHRIRHNWSDSARTHRKAVRGVIKIMDSGVQQVQLGPRCRVT